MLKNKAPETPFEITDTIRSGIKSAFANILDVTADFSVTRDKGYYGVCYAKPSKMLRNALGVDREMLILISTFEDQQSRTIQTAKDLIRESGARLDTTAFVIVHKDERGNSKLKRWGREQGMAVLPIFYDGELPKGDVALKTLCYELFSYDVFDVTGPVADDLQFYGRREQAKDLAKKLQSGQIRSCFGIRKIGKTSILHRIINEVRESYDCTVILIDAQSDAIFSLDAARLMNSIAKSLEVSHEKAGASLKVDASATTMSEASECLKSAILSHPRQVLLVFDEVDYLTPTSPTASHWKSEFNPFWRNMRAIYQSSAVERQNLSILVSGVSSKWFSEESIAGVENAALSFVPEEYLTALPRAAAVAMIRRLGRTAGLVFSDQIADTIAATCADMPFWMRKACSFIHSKVDIGLRPFEPQLALIDDYLKEFVESDGAAMSEVALSHLFRVFPELRAPAMSCARGEVQGISPRILRILQKYGLIDGATAKGVSGEMMATGLSHLRDIANINESAEMQSVTEEALAAQNDYGDWADELAIISRRRNVLERKLRGLVANFLRFSSMNEKLPGGAKERVLRCLDSKRRNELQRFDLDDMMSKLFWLELIAVIKNEWTIFERVFGDKTVLERNTAIVNNRPDAHAKDIDIFDAALHRDAVGWFEDRVGRI